MFTLCRIRRTIVLTAIIILPIFSAHAQGYFDWVKSYSAPDPSGYLFNYIVGSVTDSHGNLYVAGGFASGASIDGQDLLPTTPDGGHINDRNMCILKISPSGNIMWKKILHVNNGGLTSIYDLQLVGDTALWVNASFSIPQEDNEYLYFYDTLITKNNVNCLLYTDSISLYCNTTAISSFDLDGNLTENYILYMAYKDSNGKLITLDMQTNNDFDSVYINNQQFHPGVFRVDNQGNIYLGHLATEVLWLYCDTCESQLQRYDLTNGLISEIVVMVNGHQRFFNVLPERSNYCNYRIMKFAPHFSDLLACRYVFSYNTESWGYLSNARLLADSKENQNHMYLLFNWQAPSAAKNIHLQGDISKFVSFTNDRQGVVIEYDDSLIPLDVIQITPEQSISQISDAVVLFNNLILSKDSNVLFIIGTLEECGSGFIPAYRNQTIDLGNAISNAFALRLERGNNSLEYTNYIRSNQGTIFHPRKLNAGAVESNGRLFAQAAYMGNIQWSDSSISIASNKLGAGVFVWDYLLCELDFIDLNIESFDKTVSSSLSIHDSNLYIMVASKDGFTLSNTIVPCVGNSVAVIAKYVDSSFCFPYLHHEEESESIENIDIMHVKCYPNPTNSTITFELPEDETINECYVISSNGIRHQERVSANSLNLSKYRSGIYYIELITNNNIYKHKIIKL